MYGGRISRFGKRFSHGVDEDLQDNLDASSLKDKLYLAYMKVLLHNQDGGKAKFVQCTYTAPCITKFTPSQIPALTLSYMNDFIQLQMQFFPISVHLKAYFKVHSMLIALNINPKKLKTHT